MKKALKFILIGLAMFALFIWLVPSSEQLEQPVKETSPNFAEDCLSGWDGSHGNLKNAVKETLLAPSTFKHIETSFILKDSVTALVTMQYSADNAFGVALSKTVSVTVDRNSCHILEEVYYEK